MSLTVLNWPLILTLIAISALPLFQRSSAARRRQPNPETHTPREDSLRGAALGGALHGPALALLAAAAAFLLIAGVGTGLSYFGGLPLAPHLADASALSTPAADPDSEALASLTDYTRSIASEATQSKPADGELLPDVSTMIEQLAARLETAPGDIDGWRMLGWSYFHTGHYDKAAAAYAKAMALDPTSAELERAYAAAMSEASSSDSSTSAATLPSAAAGSTGASASPQDERAQAIRSMVERLASRLESSPRDVEGWARLMRSRVVLGERALAATALRKALAVFRDDAAASQRLTAAGSALGLKTD